jgi:hypothetical protein
MIKQTGTIPPLAHTSVIVWCVVKCRAPFARCERPNIMIGIIIVSWRLPQFVRTQPLLQFWNKGVQVSVKYIQFYFPVYFEVSYGVEYVFFSRLWRVLTMVYNTQKYWVSGLRPSSRILNSRNYNVSETGYVPILRWRGRHLLCWVP